MLGGAFMMAKTASRENHLSIAALPVEEVAKYPLPGMAVPGELAFSPDDRLITYLFSPERDLVRQLYAFDPATGERHLVASPPAREAVEEELSLEEALRRERQRQRELGVTRYAWAKDANRILLPLEGGLYIKDGPDAALRRLPTDRIEGGEAPVLDPQLSPDGNWAAYVQDAELYVVAAESGQPRQLTQGARGTGKTHGLAEFIAQEEMRRGEGFWWSPDSRWIAFTEVDETHIPIYRIMHLGKDVVGEGAQEDHRYPFVGQANARVRLGVVSVEGGETVWMDLGEKEDVYLARMMWFPDGSLSAQIENREQTRLDLVRFDPRTGQGRTLLQETSAVWINLHDMFRPLEPGTSPESNRRYDGGFIWASERTGFCHLYLYDKHGNLIRPLTQGEWVVDEVVGVDQEREQVYFIATRDSPVERHLYAVSFAGGTPRRVTQAPGTHTVVVDHACRRFVDVYQALDRPPTVTLRALADDALLDTLHDAPDPRVEVLGLQPPELVTLQNRTGVTLYGALYRPPARFGAGPFPTIVSVYGGPHVQLVTDSWAPTVAMRAQHLRSLGFLVFVLDNRGSAGRGLAFEGVIKHDLGHREVEDQVDGVRWLAAQGLADPTRVGIYGWSYGGYMALMCLARAPETFHVAVAGAPTTHLDGYDTHYTERYMGTPESNPEGYVQSSVIEHVAHIRGKLLLVHGLIDENVHLRHTARLINALIKARKPYDFLLFPDERHMPRKLADRVYMEERIRDYFVQHLLA
jgi:dipeptidyl-peptidase 4